MEGPIKASLMGELKQLGFNVVWNCLLGWLWIWGNGHGWRMWVGYAIWVGTASYYSTKVYRLLWPREKPFNDEYRVCVNIIYNVGGKR